MNKIFIPSTGPDGWQALLADPEKQWRTGYSARSMAYSWEAAKGFPAEIDKLLKQSGYDAFEQVELLLAIPEYKVPLPGGGRASQNDVFAIGRDGGGQLVTMAVEGKVQEPFGPTLADWDASSSPGKQERLAFLQDTLGLPGNLPDEVRYQLLHRTASAVIEAKRFNASTAMMIVHSFSQEDHWFEEYQYFLSLFGQEARVGQLVKLNEIDGITLYTGWARGQARFLQS
ncbi:DUF6946 family protein [Chloroflexota bacterium]